MAKFEITRKDGRANSQVLIDLVKGAEAGRLFTYEELGEALSEGAPHGFNVRAVRGVVISALARLLKEHQIALHNVRGSGYRVAHANEHTQLALVRTRRADTQIRRGMLILRNTRWDEMDPAARAAHEGMLLVMSGFYQQQQAVDKRLRNLERAFAKLEGVDT